MSRSLSLALISLVTLLPACDAEIGSADEHQSDAAPTVQAGDACETFAASWQCGDFGTRFCDDFDGELQWGPCIPAEEIDCTPEGEEQGCGACVLFGGVPAEDWDGCGGDTPLVLRFDDAPISYSQAGSFAFDIANAGECVAHDWPTTAKTPWLAMDRDGNGQIDDGRELFGSGTELSTGKPARNGFIALAELDANDDGRIDEADPGFAELLTWSDYDDDRRSARDELSPVGEVGLVSIDLQYAGDKVCDARGNCGIERAAFVWRERSGELRSGEVVDVHLPCR